MPEREFDVVVFGATSVTGRRVAAYLAERTAADGIRWAAAARDRAKLDRVLADEGVAEFEPIEADVGDRASLVAMAGRTSTVVNLVGPYTRYATPVIDACVTAGAHYVDLTGEIPFVRRVIDGFDPAAQEAGVKIVQVCGFEALPPDLGVLLAAETARERFGQGLAEAEVVVAVTGSPSGMPRASDFLSGGTLQSMAEVTGDPDADRLTDPGVLLDDPDEAAAVRRRSPITVAPRRSPSGAVIAPMSPAAFINPAVIHRSAELDAAAREQRFEPFRYREGVAIAGPAPTLPFRYAAAGALSAIQAGMARTARSRPAMRARMSSGMRRLFPSSGFGPRADRLEAWRWRMDVSGRTAGGDEVSVAVEAEGHPGYLATARMMGEAGLMLADEGATPDRAGCLTPAIALGTAEIGRFEHARLRFTVG